MDRKTLLAVTLCFLIYLGWQKFYIQPYYQAGPTSVTSGQIANPSNLSQNARDGIQEEQTQQDRTTTSQSSPTLHPAPAPVAKRPSQKLPLHTSIGEAILGDDGRFFADWTLKSYKLDISPEAASVNLNSVTNQGAGELGLAFEDPSLAYLNGVQGEIKPTPQGAIWTYEDANVKLTREFTASEQAPYVDLKINADFKTKAPRYAFVSVAAKGLEKDPEAQDRQLVYWTQDAVERVSLKDSVPLKEIPTPVKYVGATNRYFIMAAVANPTPTTSAEGIPVSYSGSNLPKGLIQSLPAQYGQGQSAGQANLVYSMNGNSVSIPLRVYFGPKDLEILRKVEPTLDHTVDFGWFTVFAYPLLKILKWLYQFLQNYGLAIIFLTILLKIATYPLTYKSMKSMKKMAALQPQLQKIREKYKDDKEALNREMLTLMRSHGYNPAAGCLPILIQMPIFFALYRVLYSSIELYHAPFALWIRDLSSHDPFYVTPVLLSLTMFIQQKLTPNTATDPAQAKMMQLMPLIFGAFMLALPSGLTVYMLVNAITSILQQLILNKKFATAPAS
jgi:YidC/Oxa1 family membrane protein insertase